MEGLEATPSLYLFSDTDRVTDYRYVEYVIEQKRKHNFPVIAQKFIGSGHCAHLVKHNKAYKEAVKLFVEDIENSNL